MSDVTMIAIGLALLSIEAVLLYAVRALSRYLSDREQG